MVNLLFSVRKKSSLAGILEESIEYCRAEKGMEVFVYCFMPSHVHLIFRSSNRLCRLEI